MNNSYYRRLQRIKHQRYKARKQNKALFRKRAVERSIASHLQHKGYQSSILDRLKNKHFKLKGFKIKEYIEFEVPTVFCFSKEPNASILFLRKLYTAAIDPIVTHIHFSHLKCCYLGVCASTVMDIILLECIKYKKSRGLPFEISGTVLNNRVSYNNDVDSLVKMSGLLKHLNIYQGGFKNTEQLELIKNGDSSKVAEKSIEYIDKSLRRHNMCLTKMGKNLFGSFFGEVVENCKHGGETVSWFTIGHYSFDEQKQLGKCKLSIIDFGDTIYEGLLNCDSKSMLKRINHYVRKTIFSFKSVNNQETLYTLFSLQQRTSRVVSKNVVRGNGTITFIDAFLNLFTTQDEECQSLFSITSGKCSILFDGKYKLVTKEFQNGYQNKIISFNDSGNLYEEPDSDYVRTLENYFPGTIVSMDLYIDSKYIEGVD